MAWGVAYPALYLLSCLLTPWFAQPFLAWSRFPVTKQSQPPMWPQRALCNSSHPAAYGPSPQLVSDGDRREGFLSWLLASHPPVLEFREFHEVCSPWISPLSRQLWNPPAQNRRYRSCYRYLIPSSMPRVFQGTAMAWSAPIFPFSRMYMSDKNAVRWISAPCPRSGLEDSLHSRFNALAKTCQDNPPLHKFIERSTKISLRVSSHSRGCVSGRLTQTLGESGTGRWRPGR